MIRGEEIDLREGLVYDPAVSRSDTNFWRGDTVDLTFDTVRTALLVGDSGLPGSASSFSQYLYGDFEYTIQLDSLSPDTFDTDKRWGLLNLGDTLERGAAYFQIVGDSDGQGLSAVIVDEAGTSQSDSITWDTTWNNSATRFRIKWEDDGYTFLVNDTVVATLGDRSPNATSVSQINTSIPQALRISNRTSDDTAMQLKLVNVRHSRKII